MNYNLTPKAEQELVFITHSLFYEVSSNLHDIWALLWLMNKTDKREELLQGLQEVQDRLQEVMKNELEQYYSEVKNKKP